MKHLSFWLRTSSFSPTVFAACPVIFAFEHLKRHLFCLLSISSSFGGSQNLALIACVSKDAYVLLKTV